MLITADSTTVHEPAPPKRQIVSLPFLFLRGISTAGLIAASIIQIFVFARVMSPQTFSIFILVGTVGYSLSLVDLGVVKFLFVRARALRLAGKHDPELARQSTAIVMLYSMLCIAGAFLCFLALTILQLVSVEMAFGFALFFLFTSTNFPWYALRYISISVDDYVFFETVEAARRFASIGLMLLMLVGLSVPAFLVLVNLLWAVSLAIVIVRLRRMKILGGRLRGALQVLWPFYRDNRRDLTRTGMSATADYYIEFLPYLVVPLTFGLGAPTVILDAIFKFVHGAANFYNAICDIAVPQQTSAIASRDIRTLIYSTLLAFGMAVVPTVFVSAGLIFAGDLFFKLLLGPAATMPPEAIWIIIAMLFGTLVQVLSHSLLIHSGYFKEGARVMGFTAVMVTILPALAFLDSPTIIGFLGLYAAAFGIGAVLHITLAIKGPIQSARRT